MSRFVEYWNHEEGTYLTRHEVEESKVDELIRTWAKSVLPYAKKSNKQHCIYAVKTIFDYKVIKVDLYATPLDDKEFFERTDAVYYEEFDKGNTVWFGCFHKGTSY